MSHITRREAMKLAMAAGLARALPSTFALAAEPPSPTGGVKPVRVGFIGVGDRGTGLLRVMLKFPGVEIPAVCDIVEAHATRAQDLVEKARGKRPESYIKGAHDYRRLLEREDLDAVLLGTPQEWHAEMSIDAFKANKFVGAEVPACTTVEECWNLVRAHQQHKGRYMLLENYLYSQPVMMVQKMVDQGVFGDLTYGFGAYIHEIRGMRFDKQGELTWRGKNVLNTRGIVYPTHAVGPVCRWMGINKDDTLQTLVCMDSKAAGNKAFAEKRFGPDSPQAKINWENGDTSQCLIRTAKGRLIEVRYDTASPRPAGMGQYSLQGSKASYESALGHRMIYIEGRSKPHQWESLDKYVSEYQSDYWAQRGDDAKSSGHGGGDYFVISDFLQAVRTGNSPVDIYDAVTWTAVRPLSDQSARAGGKPVAVPDFRAS